MQDKVLRLMLQARNLMLPNVGCLKQYVFLLIVKLNFIATGYRRDLCMLKITTLQNLS